MKNKQSANRDDLTYPEWVEDQVIVLKLLYADLDSDMDFQSFTIKMYMDTKHDINLINRRN